ncbi:multiprotein-bridging factor 1 family protein [Streptomyces sp. NPDC090077]|uniref:helix-turn-helix domain-containing protein n=1 Tax=Streptomyces sp. NPDC090077 TaxID=3365938 RepID=UPI00382B85A0
MSTDPLWTTRHAQSLAAGQQAGGLVRLGRQALGWRQADLGERLLCSASTISRLEGGQLGDLHLLKSAAPEVGARVDNEQKGGRDEPMVSGEQFAGTKAAVQSL